MAIARLTRRWLSADIFSGEFFEGRRIRINTRKSETYCSGITISENIILALVDMLPSCETGDCLAGGITWPAIIACRTSGASPCVKYRLASGSQQLAQHEWQDAAVLVLSHFVRRVDAQQQGDCLPFAIGPVDDQRHFLLRPDFAIQARQVEAFFAGNVQ